MANCLKNISVVDQQVTVGKWKPVFKVVSSDGSVSNAMDLDGIKKWQSIIKKLDSSSSRSTSSENTDDSTNRVNPLNKHLKNVFNLENVAQFDSTGTDKQSLDKFKAKLKEIVENLEERFSDFHREFLNDLESIGTFVQHFLNNVKIEKAMQEKKMEEKPTKTKQATSKVEKTELNEKSKLHGSSEFKESNENNSKIDSNDDAKGKENIEKREKKEKIKMKENIRNIENAEIKKTVNTERKKKPQNKVNRSNVNKKVRTSAKLRELFEAKDKSRNRSKSLPIIDDILEDNDVKPPNGTKEKPSMGSVKTSSSMISSSSFATTSKTLSMEEPSSKPPSPLLAISPSSSCSSLSVTSPIQASSGSASLKPPEIFKMPPPPIKSVASKGVHFASERSNENGLKTPTKHKIDDEHQNNVPSEEANYTCGAIKKRRISHVTPKSVPTTRNDGDWFTSDDDDDQANDSDSSINVEKQQKIARMMLAQIKQREQSNLNLFSNGLTAP